MQSTFAVLAEPNRRRILDELRQGERSVGELVDGADVLSRVTRAGLDSRQRQEVDEPIVDHRLADHGGF